MKIAAGDPNVADEDIDTAAFNHVKDFLFRLINHHIMPVVVLDGEPLPGKSIVRDQRRHGRAEAAAKLAETKEK